VSATDYGRMHREAELRWLRKAIVTRANAMGCDGWLTLEVPYTVSQRGTIQIPRAPFEKWAVFHLCEGELASPWQTVSPGLEGMSEADRLRSDWLIGAGLDPDLMDIRTGYTVADDILLAADNAKTKVISSFTSFTPVEAYGGDGGLRI
jgi:hypothetical protein